MFFTLTEYVQIEQLDSLTLHPSPIVLILVLLIVFLALKLVGFGLLSLFAPPSSLLLSLVGGLHKAAGGQT